MGKGFRFLNRDLGEEYLLIKLDNSAKDYLERFREGFCFQIQYFLRGCLKNGFSRLLKNAQMQGASFDRLRINSLEK